ncbi:PLP-dependent aminotransferase family protein [Actinopolymorpha sp. B11F2]|uniref:MocR-like pyridoxine biosynthesis transcription factor PdxR n=1 Tax=Actinopolymorpha sp. B11F2 TaxID=3160862 RepID=UPI0032E38DAB
MATTRAKLAWDTLVDVEAAGPGPLHERLTRSLRQAIRDGRLPPSSALPPSRALATDLGCSRWVVTQAYEQLVAEGYLTARTGSATTVRAAGPTEDRGAAPNRPGGGTTTPGTGVPSATSAPGRTPSHPGSAGSGHTSNRYDLAPGLPDLRAFPRRRWVEAVRSQLATMPYDDLGYPTPGGAPHLREVMADYLRRVRGALTDAGDVTCCSSVSDGVARLATCLRTVGIERIAVEDPGWTRLRQTIERVGVRTVGIPVDADGLRADELAKRRDVRAVLVTPAHQFPTGVVLTPGRRAVLLDWARDVDGLILEDDYDAEFRYDRRPVGTLQGADPEHVALFGSLSKTLSPAIGIGWMVTPARWTAELRAGEGGMSMPSALDQLAFGEFVESGGYDRHLRAARQRYRRRRDALVAAIDARLPRCTLSGVAAGLHLVLRLEPGTPTAEVVARAAASGVRVADLDAYRVRPDPSAPALVLGYGNLPDGAVEPAVRLLAAAVAAVRPDASVRTPAGR